ncbi:MAG: hypothetical protein ACLP6E_12360 [Acidimicrobiales bacterium]
MLGDDVPLSDSGRVVLLVTGLAVTAVVDVGLGLDGTLVCPEAGNGAGRTRM